MKEKEGCETERFFGGGGSKRMRGGGITISVLFSILPITFIAMTVSTPILAYKTNIKNKTPLIPFPPTSQTISHDEGKRGMRNRGGRPSSFGAEGAKEYTHKNH